jgi:hypothetical protein
MPVAPAGARPGKPIPKSDTDLMIALGVVVALIVLLVLAIVVGLVVQVGDDDPDSTEETEQVDE